MKHLMLAASAFAIFAAPAHAQLLGGGGGALGGVSGSLNGTVNSTLRGSTDTMRSATRSTVRGDAATRGDQKVDRRSGDVSVDRSLDAGLDSTTNQLIETPTGSAGGNATGSGRASGSGSANASLIGTDAVRGVAQESVGQVRDSVSKTRGLTSNATGSAGGSASGAGSIGNSMLAVAGSGTAEGEGAFGVTSGMPVLLPSGEQLGTVRDIVATRAGEIRELVVQTRDGLATISAGNLAVSGNALVAGGVDGSTANDARASNDTGE